MCGRFTLTAEAKELAKRFGVEISASFHKTIATASIQQRNRRCQGAFMGYITTGMVNPVETGIVVSYFSHSGAQRTDCHRRG
jgi:putative SOS response-associated peptidase YedK